MKNLFKNIKNFLLITIFNVILITNLNSKEVPDSFADLVERLMPSVVNISATRVVETRAQNPFPFQCPPGSPFEDLFKERHKNNINKNFFSSVPN